MGGTTPNIDRIANDGMIFIDQEKWLRAEQTPLSTPIITNLILEHPSRIFKYFFK